MSFPHSARNFFRYLNMDYLIAPFLIRLIYWIGVVAIVSAGIGLMFASRDGSVPLALGGMLMALLLWRLLGEMLVLAFNLHARLVEIRDLLSQQGESMEDERQRTPPPLFLLRKSANAFDDQGTA